MNGLKRKRPYDFNDDAAPMAKSFCPIGTTIDDVQPSTLLKLNEKPIEKFKTDPSTLSEVPKIHGFQRGYELEAILDFFQDQNKQQYLYIKFKNLPMPELVPIMEAVRHTREVFLDFHKEYTEACEKGLINCS